MWRFLGSRQDIFFTFLPPLLVAPSDKHMITLRLCWKFGRRTTWPHATINYMRFWQAAQWLCRLKSRQAIESLMPLLLICKAVLKVPVSCCVYPRALTQWPSSHLQAPDTRLELSQSSGRRQLTSTPPYCLVFSTKSKALVWQSAPNIFLKQQQSGWPFGLGRNVKANLHPICSLLDKLICPFSFVHCSQYLVRTGLCCCVSMSTSGFKMLSSLNFITSMKGINFTSKKKPIHRLSKLPQPPTWLLKKDITILSKTTNVTLSTAVQQCGCYNNTIHMVC